MRRGTIGLQLRHFRARVPGFDSFFDGPPFPATLNVRLPGRRVRVGRPAFHLIDIGWERRGSESFYLSPCTLRYSGRDHRGLLYIPDPATKPHGLPVAEVLEVLTSRVPFIRYGAPVSLSYPADAVELFRPRRAGPPPALVARPPRPDRDAE